jgi:hypothetical protein
MVIDVAESEIVTTNSLMRGFIAHFTNRVTTVLLATTRRSPGALGEGSVPLEALRTAATASGRAQQ